MVKVSHTIPRSEVIKCISNLINWNSKWRDKHKDPRSSGDGYIIQYKSKTRMISNCIKRSRSLQTPPAGFIIKNSSLPSPTQETLGNYSGPARKACFNVCLSMGECGIHHRWKLTIHHLIIKIYTHGKLFKCGAHEMSSCSILLMWSSILISLAGPTILESEDFANY